MTHERKLKDIKSVPDDKIDHFCHAVINTLYPETGPGALLTNRSTLDDFEELTDIPGHELRRLSNIPKLERKHYQNDFKALKHLPGSTAPERYLVWYPPLSKAEWKQIEQETRRIAISRLETAYGISFTDYPGKELYVWQVAEYIASQKARRLDK